MSRKTKKQSQHTKEIQKKIQEEFIESDETALQYQLFDTSAQAAPLSNRKRLESAQDTEKHTFTLKPSIVRDRYSSKPSNNSPQNYRDKLWLACFFPNIALDALSEKIIIQSVKTTLKENNQPLLASSIATTPVVICDKENRQSPVVACNKYANDQHIFPGMPLGVAIATCKWLCVIARNLDSEEHFIKSLASEAVKISPQIVLLKDSLNIEVSGSVKLFGDLETLLDHTRSRLESRVSAMQMACATTSTAAELFARYEDNIQVTNHSHLISAVSALPTGLLNLKDSIHKRFIGMGIECIGDLLRLPRDGLARRAGTETVRTLDKLTGRIVEPEPYYISEQSYQESSNIEHELDNLDAIMVVIRSMLDDLSSALRITDASVDLLIWTFHHEHHRSTEIRVKLSAPVRDSQYFYELSFNKLQQIELPDTVLNIGLSTSGYTDNQPKSLPIFSDIASTAPDNSLIDRLRARLGNHAIQGLQINDEHRPELATRYTNIEQRLDEEPDTADYQVPLRPLWLLPTPRKLQTHNSLPTLNGPLRISSNQERIESGWWEIHSIRRDYYIAMDNTGIRLWIYRDLYHPDTWYLHGIFG